MDYYADTKIEKKGNNQSWIEVTKTTLILLYLTKLADGSHIIFPPETLKLWSNYNLDHSIYSQHCKLYINLNDRRHHILFVLYFFYKV